MLCSRRSVRGFTLLEAMVALTITVLCVVAVQAIAASVLGSRTSVRANSINQRWMMESVGTEIRRHVPELSRVFIFNGELVGSSGASWTGGSVQLTKPAFEILDDDDFLVSSGMTLRPFGTGTGVTIVCVRKNADVGVIALRQVDDAGGAMDARITLTGFFTPMDRRVSVPSGASLAVRLAAAGGAVARPDGLIALTLPNPLPTSAAALAPKEGPFVLLRGAPARTVP